MTTTGTGQPLAVGAAMRSPSPTRPPGPGRPSRSAETMASPPRLIEETRPLTAAAEPQSQPRGGAAGVYSKQQRPGVTRAPPHHQSGDLLLDGWGDFDSDRLLRVGGEANGAAGSGTIRATRETEVMNGNGTSGLAHDDDEGGDDDDDDEDGQHYHGARQHNSNRGQREDHDEDSDEDDDRRRDGNQHAETGERLHAPRSKSILRRHKRSYAVASTTRRQQLQQQQQPPGQVLKQRPLAVMELMGPATGIGDAGLSLLRRSIPKKLQTHHRTTRFPGTTTMTAMAATGDDDASLGSHLPRLPGPSPSSAHRRNGLLGPHIRDTAATRAAVFNHFRLLWCLMCSRPTGSTPAAAPVVSNTGMGTMPLRHQVGRVVPTSELEAAEETRKSPFECSMALTKICKSLGIAVNSSVPPGAWLSTRDGGDVDFGSFCDVVVRHAVQPALHHFNLDRTLEDFVHTLEAILESVTRTAEGGEHQERAHRICELGEIQGVLPMWRKGIAPAPSKHQSPPVALRLPGDAGSEAGGGDGGEVTTTLLTHVPPTLDAIVVPKKLPVDEAKAQHNMNIRRKIQLRMSWQPRVLLVDSNPGGSLNNSGSLLDGVSGAPISRSGPLGDNNAPDPVSPVPASAVPSSRTSPVEADKSALSRVKESPPVADDDEEGTSTTNQEDRARDDNNERQLEGEDDEEDEEERVLVCGMCVREDAALWCSGCFEVFCGSCWSIKHHSRVDTSREHTEGIAATLTARALGTADLDNNVPVAMVYLPTKPIVSGKLYRGLTQEAPVDDHQYASHRADPDLPTTSLFTKPILPALKPVTTRKTPTKTVLRHRSMSDLPMSLPPTDSTANLLKALMLGSASSASTLGTSAGSSSLDSSQGSGNSSRVFKDPTNRKPLHTRAIQLDPSILFQS